MAFSSDGQTGVTGDIAGNLRTWDLASGRQLGSVHAHDSVVQDVRYRPDGCVIASSGRSSDSTARLWDSRSLKPLV
jgi:WD40 repeat protein